ncbi:MAG TPA: tetratricopeptide repeat protein [Candidatus Omnitrophota bacterium]|nr:tetratricopeptide repeat protein [Candidatus Omnitrophota bacterium]
MLKPKILFNKKIALVLYGLFLCFMLLEIGLRLGGFIFISVQEHRNLQSIKQKDSYRILCLGESTTAGQFPGALEEILNQRNTGIKFSVIDKGVIGTNTTAILLNLEQNLKSYKPDMVIIMAGGNDAGISYYQDIPEAAAGIFRHCRTYRFMRLVYMHIVQKFKNPPATGLKNKIPQGNVLPPDPKIDPEQAAKTLDRIIKLNPQEDNAYVRLGRLLRDQGKFPEAEDLFKKAMELNPNNDDACFELGRLLRDQHKFPQAEDLFKKTLEINPRNDNAYSELGWNYMYQGKLPQAEALLKQALELNPQNNYVYFKLGWLYVNQGKLPQAEALFKKAVEIDPQNDNAYRAILALSEKTNQDKSAQEYTDIVRQLKLWFYNPTTVNNYRKLKEILDRRGVKLVCMQYPMRDVEPLKRIFKNDTGVIFVDNEKIFKEALRQSSYKEYFRDMFAGDFGHCTDKGNRLLATNIANVILKEVFDK